MTLNVRIERVRLADLIPAEVNARYMTKDQHDALVRNVKKDGALTSVPLVYWPESEEAGHILSGHHRTAAALEALGGDVEADVMRILDEQSRQEIVARQLSHNAISGQDDDATLKALYDELDEVDWRDYSGLDDKALGLLEKVDVSALSEANLEYLTVTTFYLPDELERAEAAFEEARKAIRPDVAWLAPYREFERTLDAVRAVRDAYRIGNVATCLAVILTVFENHLDDLKEGWFDPATGLPTRTGDAPIESVFGTLTMPAEALAVVEQAMLKAENAGEIGMHNRWLMLERWAADYLAG